MNPNPLESEQALATQLSITQIIERMYVYPRWWYCERENGATQRSLINVNYEHRIGNGKNMLLEWNTSTTTFTQAGTTYLLRIYYMIYIYRGEFGLSNSLLLL